MRSRSRRRPAQRSEHKKDQFNDSGSWKIVNMPIRERRTILAEYIYIFLSPRFDLRADIVMGMVSAPCDKNSMQTQGSKERKKQVLKRNSK
jgi:hypothetical protein